MYTFYRYTIFFKENLFYISSTLKKSIFNFPVSRFLKRKVKLLKIIESKW